MLTLPGWLMQSVLGEETPALVTAPSFVDAAVRVDFIDGNTVQWWTSPEHPHITVASEATVDGLDVNVIDVNRDPWKFSPLTESDRRAYMEEDAFTLPAPPDRPVAYITTTLLDAPAGILWASDNRCGWSPRAGFQGAERTYWASLVKDVTPPNAKDFIGYWSAKLQTSAGSRGAGPVRTATTGTRIESQAWNL